MREFFRGWRRKTGIVILLVTLMLVVCWMRSMVKTDFIALNFGGPFDDVFASTQSRMVWIYTSSTPRPLTGQDLSDDPAVMMVFFEAVTTSRPLNVNIFQLKARSISYWFLILPLTLLSAALLLLPHRKNWHSPTASGSNDSGSHRHEG